jgi:hypothetical protein
MANTERIVIALKGRFSPHNWRPIDKGVTISEILFHKEH